MKMLMVGGWASFAIWDIQEGYRTALKQMGVDVGMYLLDKRLSFAKRYLAMEWRTIGKRMGLPKWTGEDEVQLACEEIPRRAGRYQPDWTMFVAGRHVDPDTLIALKNDRHKTALLSTENPYDDGYVAWLAQWFDVVFVNERTSAEKIQKVCPKTKVHYLRHAYDPAKHHPGAGAGHEDEIPAHEVLFVGTDFPERLRTLAAVDWRGIDLALYGQWSVGKQSSRVRPYIKGGLVQNTGAVALYNRAKINLNLYRTLMGFDRKAEQHVYGAESLNPRALELAACGAFTISDFRPEVKELFGDAVPLFDSPEELGDLCRYYLGHEDERQAMASRLPGLVAGQTYEARAREMLEVLEHV